MKKNLFRKIQSLWPGLNLRLLTPMAAAAVWLALLTAGCTDIGYTPASKSHSPPAASGTVTLSDFSLVGNLTNDQAAFTLSAKAHVDGAHGGSLDLLAGPVALTDVGTHPRWDVGVTGNKFVLNFDHSGDFPVQLKFSAAVRQNNGWNSIGFQVAPATLQPIVLQGLGPDTQFQFAGAARPDRSGSNFTSFLPADGVVQVAWKEARKEEEGKLFYAAEALSQITVGPGMMRQAALLDFKVMQGELNEVTLHVHGAGEVTGVFGDTVLAFDQKPIPNSDDRLLIVKLNQPQKDHFAFQVQMQSSLGEFPQETAAMELRPEGGTRFAGYFRVVNEGAVRLEVTQAKGLSQISPEQFPETDATRGAFRAAGNQRFAYRFSGPDFALNIRAEQVIPELSVSEVLAYHLGENEQAIDAELELDIRDAPLHELLLHVPRGYAVARVTGGDDYSTNAVPDDTNAVLKLIYVQPISGRQVVQLRLERNAALDANEWNLPRVEVVHAKSIRGNVGVSADPGFRLTAERTQSLTEIAIAYFPAKVAGLQAAFRLSDADWSATMQVERLPQTVQADVLHLFSVGEGIAYGSSVINYTISGSPVSAFKIELPEGYTNVEFTGKDVLPPQKTDTGYLVRLHTPVSGAYTLLATYERPFRPQGETLSFTGARPVDVLSEQGYTLVISTYQFQVKPADVSTNLLKLEPGEVPAEDRLFFDAPILAAYRYTARPFNLNLALSPLAQGDSVSQVVDRATITNRISKEGQVLTDVRYFVKNRGNTHFRLTLPEGTELWAASVNNAAVVPVKDGTASLIPLPQLADPNAVLTLDLKLARAKSPDPRRLTVAVPIAGAPVMLEEWKLEPDPGQRLVYHGGSLTPVGGLSDISGFAAVARLLADTGSEQAQKALTRLLLLAGLILLSVVAWRWSGREETVRLGVRHAAGLAVGAVSFLLALGVLLRLGRLAGHLVQVPPRDLTFLAPVQQAGSALTVDVSNLPASAAPALFGFVWPALLALVIWLGGWLAGRGPVRFIASLLGWTVLAWAALRSPNGAPAFVGVVAAFLALQIGLPAFVRAWRTPRGEVSDPPPASASGAPAVLSLLLGGLVWLALGSPATASAQSSPLAESVTQQIRVEGKFALATAKIHWQAGRGEVLPLLMEPAVLTRASYPTHSLKLQQTFVGNRRVEQLVAQSPGAYDIEVEYQMQVSPSGVENGFTLPTPYGLINQLRLTLKNLNVDVVSPQAVSIQRETDGSNTVATLVLSPLAEARVGWRPRSRDVKGEKPVFFANCYQLYAPSAGVIEGVHYVVITPSQGELNELLFDVPAGATITDVFEPVPAGQNNGQLQNAPLVSLWRFDPDAHRLRVDLRTAQSQKFALVVRSQVATGPLPVEQSVGLVSVENAAQQTGFLGVATGNEVQLDSVDAATNNFSSISLGDFPAELASSLQAQIPGITMRRAYKYASTQASASLKASAVEPDVRVDTHNTLSLSEDRTVLAATANVDIERAGIFKLTFLLPSGMDVDSITGQALSHWTDAKTDAGRLITLNLLGKTQGPQQFNISLSGPGIKTTNGWAVPQLVLREAGKQTGDLLIVPEQGMQLQAASPPDGVTELDPQKAGIRQKGVLAFRILQTPWNVALKIEQLEPWIQVMGLQHSTVSEADVKVAANLQYNIENTGLKAFHVLVPADAQGVRFQGDQVSGSSAVAGALTNGMQAWEIKLDRRVIGQYLLQLNYDVPLSGQAAATTLRGVQALEVNTQRGFVTIQSGGRLQLRDAPLAALQPAEWQSIPRALQKDLQAVSANFAYRLVEPAFSLPLQIERHEAEQLLPARVDNVTFNSVISDAGVMLTQARLEMVPGDKRLLSVKLPAGASFWFAFVNQNGVWPWHDGDNILIPLEQPSRDGKPVPVEIFYTTQAGAAGGRSLDLNLLAPKFDLPLENITWLVHLNNKWKISGWTGSLQLQGDQAAVSPAAVDAQSYLRSEDVQRNAKNQEAEEMLNVGNSLLQKGDTQLARRAFQSAYGLSQGNDAFNEDARVQLNNLKLQQALVGLNVAQAEANGGNADALGGNFRDLRNRKDVNYTQQDAKDIIDRNSLDENTAFMALAKRLVEQQDAAVSSPATIRANIPEQGRVLTFQRAVAADKWADLNIGLKATAARAASSSERLLILAMTFVGMAFFGLLGWLARPAGRVA